MWHFQKEKSMSYEKYTFLPLFGEFVIENNPPLINFCFYRWWSTYLREGWMMAVSNDWFIARPIYVGWIILVYNGMSTSPPLSTTVYRSCQMSAYLHESYIMSMVIMSHIRKYDLTSVLTWRFQVVICQQHIGYYAMLKCVSLWNQCDIPHSGIVCDITFLQNLVFYITPILSKVYVACSIFFVVYSCAVGATWSKHL